MSSCQAANLVDMPLAVRRALETMAHMIHPLITASLCRSRLFLTKRRRLPHKPASSPLEARHTTPGVASPVHSSTSKAARMDRLASSATVAHHMRNRGENACDEGCSASTSLHMAWRCRTSPGCLPTMRINGHRLRASALAWPLQQPRTTSSGTSVPKTGPRKLQDREEARSSSSSGDSIMLRWPIADRQPPHCYPLRHSSLLGHAGTLKTREHTTRHHTT